jgi:hypothetical protein
MRSLALLSLLLVALLVVPAPGWAAGDWTWPVHGDVLTQFRNGDDPYAAGQHRGVDIAGPVGTPVVAASSGTVEFAGVVGSSGLVVSERTADGRYELSYLHLSAASVRRGDSVDRGDRLGAVGVSGTRSVDAPHLHFGVREAGDRHAYLDPLTFLAPPPSSGPEPAPAPVPVRSPAPAAPAAALVPAPLASAPAPVSAPGVAAHPLPHARHATGPRHVHAGAPRAGAVVAHQALRALDVPARMHGHSAGAGHRVAAPGHGPAGARLTAPAPPAARPAAAADHHDGVDAGWLVACGGLVLAAALLAAPRGGSRPRRSARAAFGLLVRAASK